MKDWLTVIIALLIIGIILDGVRRMRLAKRESIALSKNAKKADEESEFCVSTSEFPSGGARVAAVRDEKDAESLNENVRKNFETQRVTTGTPRKIPEQVSLNLEESVPMLMDSVEEDTEQAESHVDQDEMPFDEAVSPSSSDAAVDVADVTINETAETHVSAGEFNDPREPSLGNFADLNDDDLDAGVKAQSSGFSEPKPAEQKIVASAPPEQTPKNDSTASSSAGESEPQYQEPEEVLIMNLMAKSGTRIAGGDLLKALMAEGLKFGDMEIFHRHKDNDGDGPILYSIANMVVPGTFNLAAMEEFETPGVSIFLSLPVAGESLAAYNDMATTAKRLAAALECELKDENRSVMTGQTIEHGRQRVVEFERKRKLARA